MGVVTVERKILEKNDEVAAGNREFFKQKKMFVINIVSSPGSGKTTLLERMLEQLNGKIAVAVIEGDIQTDLDAKRVERYGVPVAQIITRGGCHLEANLVRDALHNLNLDGARILIIENVGNLVCPANYDLGEDMKVVVVSTTEGDEKPLKYPAMFRNASVLIINKIDLLPYVQCNIDQLKQNALSINPRLKIFETSCTTKKGITEWLTWLTEQSLNPV